MTRFGTLLINFGSLHSMFLYIFCLIINLELLIKNINIVFVEFSPSVNVLVALLCGTTAGIIVLLTKNQNGISQQYEKHRAIVTSPETGEKLKNKKEDEEEEEEEEEDSDDEIELSPDFRLPYFTDSEEEFEENSEKTSLFLSRSVSSSGYNSEPELDMDWELYKIFHAPPGPVSCDQTYLTFSCQRTDRFVKAVVDENHSIVFILKYEKSHNDTWSWTETNCESCIEKVRAALTEGGCTVPFAIDLNCEFGVL